MKWLNKLLFKYTLFPIKDAFKGFNGEIVYARTYENEYVYVCKKGFKVVYAIPIERFSVAYSYEFLMTQKVDFLEFDSSKKIMNEKDLINSLMKDMPSLGIM